MVRSHELVRHDVPKNMIEADFQFLQNAIATSQGFAKLFGITTVNENSILAANHPFTATQIGRKVSTVELKKGAYPNYTNKLIAKVKQDTGCDIKDSDNKYHRAEKYGTNVIHWYSDALCPILIAVRDGAPFALELP
jgi:hypothetical protein